MTNSQKLAVRSSEIRSRLNDLSGMPTAKLTDALRAETDALTTEYRDVESQYRAALVAEGDDAEQRAANKGGVNEDSETRERRALRGRLRIGNYVGAALEMRGAVGAELEYNQALNIGANQFPLEMLAPAETEHRETTNTDTSGTPRRWLDRLFADTAAMRLGVTFETVEPGAASFPVTTAGASAAQRGRKEALADAAWTVGVTEIKPTRNGARAIFTMEDVARVPGLEDALVRDLRSVVTEKVDRTVFLGDAGADETRANIVGLKTAAITEKEVTQSNKVKGPQTLTPFAELVDGTHASSLSDLRIVSAVGANALWLTTVINSAAENQTMAQFLRSSGLAWTVRGEVETLTTNNKFGAFVGRGRGIEGAGVAAVWAAGEMVRDPYSGAAKGETALTINYLWGLKFPRTSSFARIKFVT